MPKDTPFFKFDARGWLSGSIQFTSLECKGLFVDLCALYWDSQQPLKLDAKLKVRIRCDEGTLTNLIGTLRDLDIIAESEDGITIPFLDDLIAERQSFIRKCSNAGKKSKGSSSNLQGSSSNLEGSSSNKKEERRKKNEEKREEKEEVGSSSAQTLASLFPQSYPKLFSLIGNKGIADGVAGAMRAGKIDDDYAFAALDTYERLDRARQYYNISSSSKICETLARLTTDKPSESAVKVDDDDETPRYTPIPIPDELPEEFRGVPQ